VSRKIKVELTEKQLLSVTDQLGFDLIDLSLTVAEGGEDWQSLRVMKNARNAMIKAHAEWRDGK
tara:strand:- start:182 stop:373 length:192 start_codon:yes stop_codon:yes gene_type:complete